MLRHKNSKSEVLSGEDDVKVKLTGRITRLPTFEDLQIIVSSSTSVLCFSVHLS